MNKFISFIKYKLTTTRFQTDVVIMFSIISLGACIGAAICYIVGALVYAVWPNFPDNGSSIHSQRLLLGYGVIMAGAFVAFVCTIIKRTIKKLYNEYTTFQQP